MRLLLLLLLTTSCAAQTVNQWELRKRTSTGFTSYGITSENGKAIGFTAGIPAMIAVGGSATWGAITGTLTDQTDLNTALGLKLATTTAATTYAPIASPTFTGIVTAGAGTVIITDESITATSFIGNGLSLSNLNASNLLNGTIPIARFPTVTVGKGGTGATTLTANNVILGNGTSAVQFVAPGTSGNVLTSNGTTWTSAAASSSGHTIAEEGSDLTARATLNFIGGGITAADNAGSSRTDVTVTRSGVYRTLWLPASAGIPRTTAGCGVGSYESTTNKLNYDTLEFDADTDEHVQWLVKMPDEWDGSTVKAKVAWTAASGSGVTYWEIKAVALTNDDAIDTALGTAATTNDTLTATGDLDETAATGALTISNTPAAGKYVLFQLARDADHASDTLAVDALVLGLTIQYAESSTEPSSW